MVILTEQDILRRGLAQMGGTARAEGSKVRRPWAGQVKCKCTRLGSSQAIPSNKIHQAGLTKVVRDPIVIAYTPIERASQLKECPLYNI